MSSSKQSMMPKRRKVLIYILVFITGGAVLTTLAIKLPIEGYDLLRITGSRAEIYPLYCKSIDYEPAVIVAIMAKAATWDCSCRRAA